LIVRRGLEVQAAQSASFCIERQAALIHMRGQAARRELFGAKCTREKTSLVLHASHVDEVRPAQRQFREDHESTRTKGTGVTNRPPQAAMPWSWRRISSWRFHG